MQQLHYYNIDGTHNGLGTRASNECYCCVIKGHRPGVNRLLQVYIYNNKTVYKSGL